MSVRQIKILGIWIQDNLKWDKNITEITKKANRRLYMLRMLKKFGFNHQELITGYKGSLCHRPNNFYLSQLVWVLQEYSATNWEIVIWSVLFPLKILSPSRRNLIDPHS